MNQHTQYGGAIVPHAARCSQRRSGKIAPPFDEARGRRSRLGSNTLPVRTIYVFLAGVVTIAGVKTLFA